MADFGAVIASKVNSTQWKIKITYASITSEILLLQDARMPLTGTEYREPTTSAGPVYYSGQPANRLDGTALFSTDAWKNASNNFAILLTKTNGEKPVFKLVATMVDTQGTPVTDTFTWDPATGNSGAKLESVIPQKAPEGAVKKTIGIVLIGDPVIT